MILHLLKILVKEALVIVMFIYLTEQKKKYVLNKIYKIELVKPKLK